MTLLELRRLQSFWDLCNTFDWFYEMSDDHSVWQRGCAAQGQMERIAKENGAAFGAMWKAFREHHYSGKSWGSEKKPKPERPNG